MIFSLDSVYAFVTLSNDVNKFCESYVIYTRRLIAFLWKYFLLGIIYN